jgi:hypothetical protein
MAPFTAIVAAQVTVQILTLAIAFAPAVRLYAGELPETAYHITINLKTRNFVEEDLRADHHKWFSNLSQAQDYIRDYNPNQPLTQERARHHAMELVLALAITYPAKENPYLIIDKVANGQYDAYIGVHNKQPAVSPDGALVALCNGKDGKMIWISASELAAMNAEQVQALMQAQCAPLK